MSSFYSQYNSIFLALKTALETKTSLKTVVVGERYSYESGLPAAIINVDPSPISQYNSDQLQVQVNFSVMLLCRTEEPDDWFTDVLSVMGDVIDAVLADRTLSGTVFDVTPTGFAPGNIKFANRAYFGGVVKFSGILMF